MGKKKDVLKQSTLKNLLGSLDKEIEEEEEKKGTQQKMLLVAEKYGLMTFLFETAEESDVWFRAIQQEVLFDLLFCFLFACCLCILLFLFVGFFLSRSLSF